MERHNTLFTDHADLPPGSHLLLAQLDDADLLASLAQRHELTIHHRDHSALQRLAALLGHHPHVRIAADAVLPPPAQTFDAALVGVPKSRGFARAVLYTALRALKDGRRLYAVGPNNAGAKTAETDAATLAQTRTLGTKARHRLFTTVRPAGPLMAPPEWDAPWEPRPIPMTLAGHTFSVTTQPGIFSWDHPDDGTAFLLETVAQHLPPPHTIARILDAACGYGLVGIAAQRLFSPKEVVFADIDLLALNCVRQTVPGAPVVPHDLTASPLQNQPPFDLILCNPPFHQEHAKDLSFMKSFPRHARTMLAAGGRLALVANAFLPYEDLLAPHFASVSKIADNKRYRILLAQA